jgi:hypothetical protein
MENETEEFTPHPRELYRALLTDEGRAALRQLNELLSGGEADDPNAEVEAERLVLQLWDIAFPPRPRG